LQTRLRVYITGEPGVGKTTIFLKVIDKLKSQGYSISGFYCPEVREKGQRIGFKIKSLDNEVEDWLASIYAKSSIKIGKYYITINEDIINKIKEKISKSEIIGIDEIGPMELSVPKLKEIIDYVLNEKPIVVAVVHRKISFKDGKTFVVTYENRNRLDNEIFNYIISSIQ